MTSPPAASRPRSRPDRAAGAPPRHSSGRGVDLPTRLAPPVLVASLLVAVLALGGSGVPRPASPHPAALADARGIDTVGGADRAADGTDGGGDGHADAPAALLGPADPTGLSATRAGGGPPGTSLGPVAGPGPVAPSPGGTQGPSDPPSVLQAVLGGAGATTPACVPAPLAERAAAVLVVGLPGVTGPEEPLARELVELGVGGVFLSTSNVVTAAQTSALVTGLQDGMRREHGRPLVVSTDEESGRVALARAVVGEGPSPRRLAASLTVEEVEAFAAESGARLAELGITLNLAPVVDLDDGAADGVIGDRSFGSDPDLVTAYAAAYWRGLASAGVTPTAKHFPGHGRSTTDTHLEGDVVETSLGQLLREDLVPFARAVEDGVPVIMLNHLAYRALDPHLPASLSPAAYAALREMGFEGVAMTDSLGMGAVHQRWDFPESVVLAVDAGADAALATHGSRARQMRDALVTAVQDGRLDEARLSEAAARVVALAGGDPVAMSCLDLEEEAGG
jgi:beta-N-acetylhexosaminidase